LTQRIHPKTSSPSSSTAPSVTFFSKDAQVILKLLESTAKNIGLQLRYEPIFESGTPWESDGGLCRILDERLIIINSQAPAEQKCHVILQALKRLSAEGSAIPPVVRQMLENLPASVA
jgi:hypothetical protein